MQISGSRLGLTNSASALIHWVDVKVSCFKVGGQFDFRRRALFVPHPLVTHQVIGLIAVQHNC